MAVFNVSVYTSNNISPDIITIVILASMFLYQNGLIITAGQPSGEKNNRARSRRNYNIAS